MMETKHSKCFSRIFSAYQHCTNLWALVLPTKVRGELADGTAGPLSIIFDTSWRQEDEQEPTVLLWQRKPTGCWVNQQQVHHLQKRSHNPT